MVLIAVDSLFHVQFGAVKVRPEVESDVSHATELGVGVGGGVDDARKAGAGRWTRGVKMRK